MSNYLVTHIYKYISMERKKKRGFLLLENEPSLDFGFYHVEKTFW